MEVERNFKTIDYFVQCHTFSLGCGMCILLPLFYKNKLSLPREWEGENRTGWDTWQAEAVEVLCTKG